MPIQSPTSASIENNFSKGLLTEYTGLNFPENAATDTDNCIYTLIGDVVRREGFDYEDNFQLQSLATAGQAVSEYKWNNASGDGETQFVVVQNGPSLSFFQSSAATTATPLSTQLVSTIDISGFVANNGTFDPTLECQYADGNGYLFVFQPTIDPIYVQFTAGAPTPIAASSIPLQIRDQIGIKDSQAVNVRPLSLTEVHNYNIKNQGWTSGNSWQTTSTSSRNISSTGTYSFVVGSGLSITPGQTCQFTTTSNILTRNPSTGAPTQLSTITVSGQASVSSYSGTTLILNIFSYNYTGASPYYSSPNIAGGNGNEVELLGSPQWIFIDYFPWVISTVNADIISTWYTAEGNYPSNADVWWYFKDDTDTFNPGATQPSVTLSSGQAPQGHYVLNAFNMDRTAASGLTGLTVVSTTTRPSTGCWFQGRVWYSGVNATQVGDAIVNSYSWSENIYFSQIVTSPADFGTCYMTNDPTSENLFQLLPSDGGVIQIQGCGAIYKLVPIMNALLVFAANGVWYISGNQGVGFTADDASVFQFSHVRSISGTSFVDINGYPIFWNEEGIYKVSAAQQGQSPLNDPVHVVPLSITPITVGTIQTLYDNIPLQSKLYVRGCYDPINYIVQWVYRSTIETSTIDRYVYDKILTLNTYNQAFYPYSFDTTTNAPPTITGIIYVQSPGGTAAPESTIKYLVSQASNQTFAEELDDTFVDWASAGVSNDYESFFETGYRLHGQGQRRYQVPYLYMYQRMLQPVMAYNIQSVWDYAIDVNSNRFSIPQNVTINNNKYGMVVKRHRLRGRGLVLQIVVSSVSGKPFDIMGWSAFEYQNASV